MKMTDQQSEFVEHLGRFWESTTGSRTAGRLLGWLMVCDPPHQSSSQLIDALDVSAASVSTQIRVLMQLEMVERTTFPGDRASYYRLRPGVWQKVMEGELERVGALKEIADEALKLVPHERPDRVTGLAVVVDFFLAEWPALMEKLAHRMERVTT